jgi:glutamyl-tRNA synthetase
MSNQIRVRIAPSPTGPLHLGTARSALFNFLFAKKHDGKFILRIEDTDLERSHPKFEKDIIEGLSWLGILWEEGPVAIAPIQNSKPVVSEVKPFKIQKYIGKYGPYRQSERIEIYTKYIQKLLDEDKAYYCFCTEEELERERKKIMKEGKAPIYSGKCRNLSKKEVEKLRALGKKSIIRFKVPENQKIFYNDLIRGRIEFDSNLIGDISIAKDLKTPLYNFAVVVDDYSMKISHVIRGEDHVSNTPKQLLLQKALGFPHPKYVHLPLILGPDRSKLSKRHGATSINAYRERGYLPEAMTNFMVLLGWNPKSTREIFSMKDLIKEFDLKKVGKAGAIFNINRLDYLNGFYIRKMAISKLTDICIPYLEKAGLITPRGIRWQIKESKKTISKDWLEKVIALEQERMKKLSEIYTLTDFFFKEKLNYDPKILIWKKTAKKEILENLEILKIYLSNLTDKEYKKETLEKLIKEMIAKKKKGTGEVLWPLRVALSGKKASPGPFDIAEILGKRNTIKRLETATTNLKNT